MVGLPLPGSWGNVGISATKSSQQSNHQPSSSTTNSDSYSGRADKSGSTKGGYASSKSSKYSSKSAAARKSSCTVLYDFDAQDDQELSVSEGEEVELVQPIDAGWVLCQLQNGSKTGLVPISYLEIPEHLVRKHGLAGA